MDKDLLIDLTADPTTKGDFDGDRDTQDVKKVGYTNWLIKQWLGLQQKRFMNMTMGHQNGLKS